METREAAPETAFRLATMADLQALVDLVREFCEIDRHPFDEGRIASALVPLLECDRHGVVWIGGRPPSAYAVVTWGYSLESGGRDALLDEFYVRHRGQGVGSALLRHMLADLRARGVPRVFLETELHNGDVRRFYARHGFTEETSVWMTLEADGQRALAGQGSQGE